jgi:hypothetical protein
MEKGINMLYKSFIIIGLGIILTNTTLAQTKHGLENIKVPPVPLNGVIVAVDGTVAVASIGPNITLSMSNGVLTLNATSTVTLPQPERIWGAVAVASGSNPLQFALPSAAKAGTMAVWRNGLRMSSPLDYTVLGPNLIQFIPHYTGALSPVVVVDYDPTV